MEGGVLDCRFAVEWESLIEAASRARENAHAPYSGYRVGAAVRTADGSIFAGCNVENRSYGVSLCAERSALAAAVTAGKPDFTALVVMTSSEPPAAPCGLCREALTELAPELPILLVNPTGAKREARLADLLPDRFELPE